MGYPSVSLTAQDSTTRYQIDIAQTGPNTATADLKEWSLTDSASDPSTFHADITSIVAGPGKLMAQTWVFILHVDISASWTASSITANGNGFTKVVPLTPQGYGDLEGFIAAAKFPTF